MSNIGSKSKTREILESHDFRIKKKFGQNFLVDNNILNKITEKANISKNTCVIEIGPGLGALTEKIAQKAKKVIAYEIDDTLIPILEDTLSGYENVTVLNQDILKSNVIEDIHKYFGDTDDIAVVANLPYYITTPILLGMLEANLPINRYIVMMQKEVAERISGKPSTKDYNSLSIAIQYKTTPKIVINVPKDVFIPKPNVDSAVLRLDVLKEPQVKVGNEEYFFDLVRSSFRNRRKTLINNLAERFKLSKDDLKNILSDIDINVNARAESLTIEQFAALSNKLFLITNK